MTLRSWLLAPLARLRRCRQGGALTRGYANIGLGLRGLSLLALSAKELLLQPRLTSSELLVFTKQGLDALLLLRAAFFEFFDSLFPHPFALNGAGMKGPIVIGAPLKFERLDGRLADFRRHFGILQQRRGVCPVENDVGSA